MLSTDQCHELTSVPPQQRRGLLRRHLAAVRRYDEEENRQFATAERPFLVLRHPLMQPFFYIELLKWLEFNFPDLRRRFELRLLPFTPPDPSRYALLLPWLQDPIQQWSVRAYVQACDVTKRFERSGVPLINHPVALVNGAKATTAARLGALGIRTPRTWPLIPGQAVPIEPGAQILVREDWGHGNSSRLCDGATAAAAARGFDRPIAMEFIDTRSSDGLYRKYRYFAVGDAGISVHLIASRAWEVRGGNKEVTPALCAEERAYVSARDANHALFQMARRALGLDLVAFDYAYDRDGRLVVWEANPYPCVVFRPVAGGMAYRVAPVHRSLAAMVGLYLDRADLPVPAAIDALRRYDGADVQPILARLATVKRGT